MADLHLCWSHMALYNINQAVHVQKMARGLKFWDSKVGGLYYLFSENKGADQLRSYRKADLLLCFRICKKRFSHDAAHISSWPVSNTIATAINHNPCFISYLLSISHLF